MSTSRRDFLKTVSSAAAAATLSSCATFIGKPSSKRPPNILFLMTDQHNPKTMGHLGDPNALTPTLDGLAGKGTVFTRAYTQNPVCVPARMSILTGLYSHTHGSMTNYHTTTRNHTSFAQIMRANGYKTGCFGHLHISDRNDLDWDAVNPPRDWPKWDNPDNVKPIGQFVQGGIVGRPAYHDEMYTSEWRAKELSIEYMKEWRDEPWFIQCSFYRPHTPFEPPKKHWDRIDRSKLRIPKQDYPADDLADVNPRHTERMQSRKLFDLTDEQYLDALQGYYGNLAWCDSLFGEVVDALDKMGLRDNTLIIHCADHGEGLGMHHMWMKYTFFEESVRIPMLASFPGVVPEGRTSDALIELIDLYPTWMDLLGFETPKEVQGKSFLPVLRGETEKHRDFVRSEFETQMLMQFDGRYKVIDNGGNVFPELYDLKEDPLEITNIADRPEHKEFVQKTVADLRVWAKTDEFKAPFKKSYYDMLEKKAKQAKGEKVQER
jgi:arylsulfatase A-like enzyme